MYELTQLFLYRPLFMVQLLGAEFLFAFRLEKRNRFWWRFVGSIVACLGLSFAFPVAAFNAVYSSFMFICLFAITICALCFCFKASFQNVIFCAIAGYTVQHVAQEVYEMFNAIFNFGSMVNLDFYGSENIDFDKLAQNWGVVFGFFSIYSVVFCALYYSAFMLFSRNIKKYNIFEMNTFSVIITAVLIIFVDVIFGSIVIYAVPKENNLVAITLLHAYNIACCVLALILLFELPKSKKLQREIDVLQQLHNKEKEQYFISKENIELINIKCHDLRHQIRTIGQSSALDETAVAEMAKLVDVYDSTYKTECEALNVILMEKSLICKKDEIDFSCIVDGTKLGFVKDTDVYALFGNLLDNAIEAVRSLKKEERTIGVVVKTQNGIISLNVYNSFKGKIKYDGGLPATTKKEKAHHGFGLKSVRNIVSAYGGQMQIATGNGVFDVRIVLPIKE